MVQRRRSRATRATPRSSGTRTCGPGASMPDGDHGHRRRPRSSWRGRFRIRAGSHRRRCPSAGERGGHEDGGLRHRRGLCAAVSGGPEAKVDVRRRISLATVLVETRHRCSRHARRRGHHGAVGGNTREPEGAVPVRVCSVPPAEPASLRWAPGESTVTLGSPVGPEAVEAVAPRRSGASHARGCGRVLTSGHVSGHGTSASGSGRGGQHRPAERGRVPRARPL